MLEMLTREVAEEMWTQAGRRKLLAVGYALIATGVALRLWRGGPMEPVEWVYIPLVVVAVIWGTCQLIWGRDPDARELAEMRKAAPSKLIALLLAVITLLVAQELSGGRREPVAAVLGLIMAGTVGAGAYWLLHGRKPST